MCGDGDRGLSYCRGLGRSWQGKDCRRGGYGRLGASRGEILARTGGSFQLAVPRYKLQPRGKVARDGCTQNGGSYLTNELRGCGSSMRLRVKASYTSSFTRLDG